MKKYKFTAKIEPGPGGGAFVTFPYNAEEEFGKKGSIPVQATFQGVPYSGSLMPCGGQKHMIGILKAICERIGKHPGDPIDVQIWKDDAVRTVEIPPDFHALLKKEKLLPDFEKLSYTHRKEYVRWITEAKKEETRAARLTKSITMLRKGIRTPG